ncbi:hypothetical protein Bca52824_028637 [Brassica carinata]|uniref:Beta-galactosidase galactose-binding domain-containing protein n=1 Tax=Brassica carinata TaxID=52824 RepID=A0A8X8AN59_BRACI|nr:hypothetical protein Bca52824_028637 [Brassica carinata]
MSILPDCRHVAYNTAKVGAQTSVKTVEPARPPLENGANPTLSVDSMRDVLRVFVNKQLSGSIVGHWVKAVQPVLFVQGNNDLLLLTQTVGLQVGLKGEAEKVYTVEYNEKAEWSTLDTEASPSIFMWYKTYFNTPDGTDPVVLDLGSMGKGQAWVNGHHIGRYWSIVAQKDGCDRTCDYRGAYTSDKCTTNCGKPTQTRNRGNPFKISVKTVTAGVLCGQVSESHYPPLRKWSTPGFMNGTMAINSVAPEMHLHCEEGHVISSIEFASYGTPRGSCEKFYRNATHPNRYQSSLRLVKDATAASLKCRMLHFRVIHVKEL